jgi:hypothetical protein
MPIPPSASPPAHQPICIGHQRLDIPAIARHKTQELQPPVRELQCGVGGQRTSSTRPPRARPPSRRWGSAARPRRTTCSAAARIGLYPIATSQSRAQPLYTRLPIIISSCCSKATTDITLGAHHDTGNDGVADWWHGARRLAWRGDEAKVRARGRPTPRPVAVHIGAAVEKSQKR